MNQKFIDFLLTSESGEKYPEEMSYGDFAKIMRVFNCASNNLSIERLNEETFKETKEMLAFKRIPTISGTFDSHYYAMFNENGVPVKVFYLDTDADIRCLESKL